jgi:NAD(P)H-flavin reductase
MQKFAARVISKKRLTDKIYDLGIELIEPAEMEFKAGQFVGFITPSGKQKLYSITSSPNQKSKLTFCIDISPQGEGSKFVEELKLGDSFELKGPNGVFVINEDAPDSITMIATGAGVAPFKAMLPDILEKDPNKNLLLLFGNRTEKDVFYIEYFRNLERQYPNFKFLPTLSRPAGEWRGLEGRVTKYIDENPDAFKNSFCYICGSPEMVKDTRALLLRLGLDPKAVKLEVFV